MEYKTLPHGPYLVEIVRISSLKVAALQREMRLQKSNSLVLCPAQESGFRRADKTTAFCTHQHYSAAYNLQGSDLVFGGKYSVSFVTISS
jgi:hypothetical protein